MPSNKKQGRVTVERTAQPWPTLPEREANVVGKQTSIRPPVAQLSPSSGSSRIALYARISTSNGHQDPEMQLRELREYVSRRRLTIVEEYIDAGVSGSKESRPALNRLMKDAYRRKFDAI